MKKKFSAMILIILLIGLTAIGVFIYTKNKPATPAATINPVFTYSKAKIADWWSIGNRNPQENIDLAQYDEAAYGPVSKLPVADLTIHHNGPNGKKYDDQCFVSFSHYDYPIESVEKSYQTYEETIDKWGSFTHLKSQGQTIQTHQGPLTYELRDYHTETDSGGEFMSGAQVGFIALNKSHIAIKSTCKTAENLNLTLPILSAVSLQ